MLLPNWIHQRSQVLIIVRQTTVIIEVTQRLGRVRIGWLGLVLGEHTIKIGVMVAVGTRHHPVAFPLGVRSLPVANGGEKGIGPDIVQRLAACIRLVDIHRRVGHKHTRVDRAVPVDVHVAAPAMSPGRQATIGHGAVIPEINQKDLTFPDDLPRALPHPGPLLGRGHQLDRV